MSFYKMADKTKTGDAARSWGDRLWPTNQDGARSWGRLEEEDESLTTDSKTSIIPSIRTSLTNFMFNDSAAQRIAYPEWSLASAASSSSKFERTVTIRRLPGPVRHLPFLPESWRPPPKTEAEVADDRQDGGVNKPHGESGSSLGEERLVGAMRIERKIRMPSAQGNKSRGTYIGSNPSDILSCSYSANGNQLATSCTDGTIFIFSTVPGSLFGDMLHNFRKVVAPLEKASPLDACSRVRWHPKVNADGDSEILIASYRRGYLRYWHTGDSIPHEKRNIATIQSDNEAPFQSFSMNPIEGDRLAIASENEVYIYDDVTQKEIRRLKGEERPGRDINRIRGIDCPLLQINQVKYHPEETHIILTGGWDKRIHIWDERVAGKSVRQIYGPCVCGESMDIDGRNQLVVGSWRRYDNVEIFDCGSGLRIASIGQTPSRDLPIVQPYVCKWQGDNGLIVGGSHSNGLKVIDRRDNCVISSMQNVLNPIVCVDQLAKRPECPVAAGAGSLIYFIKVNWKQLETRD